MISLSQIRAARALLDWTQDELAKKSGLSLRALNSIERGMVVPRSDNLGFIQAAFEKAGIEFGENDGVRRRSERLDVLKFEGADQLSRHRLDIMQEVRTPRSDILFHAASERSFAPIEPLILDEYFAHVARHRLTERVLMARGETYVIGPPATYRWVKGDAFGQVTYCVYGDNVAYQVFGQSHRVIIIRNDGIADMFRRQFEFSWAVAEVPWFAKSYPPINPEIPWSARQAEEARAWIERRGAIF